MSKGIALGVIGLGAGGPGIGGGDAPGPMFIDTFTDVGATALNLHVPDLSVGNGWQHLLGTMQIQPIGINVESIGFNNSRAVNDPGRVVRRMQIDWRNVLDAQILRFNWRMTDSNNFFCCEMFTFGNLYTLTKKVLGVETPLVITGPVIANTTWYTAWITDDGNNIKIYHALQGAPKPAVPLITFADTDLNTDRGIGFRSFWIQQRWDNLYAWPSLRGDWG